MRPPTRWRHKVTEMAVHIKWYDGKKQTAESWEELEQTVNGQQWSPHTSIEGYREEMAERAMAWAGIEIDTDGTALDFFWELERAGFLSIRLYTEVLKASA